MKLIKKNEDWNYAERTYKHKGYIIEETEYCEEDCHHHQARVLKGDQELAVFNWHDCLKEAIRYINKLGRKSL